MKRKYIAAARCGDPSTSHWVVCLAGMAAVASIGFSGCFDPQANAHDASGTGLEDGEREPHDTGGATVDEHPPPTSDPCGNGVLDSGEECDDGNRFDDDACVSTCRHARCGDGYLYRGVEDCDDGNLMDGDLCSPACSVPDEEHSSDVREDEMSETTSSFDEESTMDRTEGSTGRGPAASSSTDEPIAPDDDSTGSSSDSGDAERCDPDLVYVQGGSFSDGNGQVHDIDEFCIRRTEVTVLEYAGCVDAGACAEPSTGHEVYNYGVSGREEHPVNGVTWFDAVTYCAWTGGRLPTEWEWEWVARGGEDASTYPWGDTPDPNCEVAVMRDVSLGGHGCGRNTTSEVGATSPMGDSRDGVQDLAGNVAEWTATSTEQGRVLRGSAWIYDDWELFTAAYRSALPPEYALDFIGFRCADSAW